MASNAGKQQQGGDMPALGGVPQQKPMIGGMQPQGGFGGPMNDQQAYSQFMAQQGGMQPQGPALGGGMSGGQMNDQQAQMNFMAEQQRMMGNNPQMAGGNPQAGSPFGSGLAALMNSGNAMNNPNGAPNPFMSQQQNASQFTGAPNPFLSQQQGAQQFTGAPNPFLSQQPTSVQRPAGAGMPPGYRPTSDPIDGRHLRDMMDIGRRRPMGDMKGDGRQVNSLPGSIGNDLPPSLKRPTQGDYRNLK